MLRKPNHDRRPMKVETLENRVLPSAFVLGAGGLTCTPPVMVATANPCLAAPALTATAAGPHGPRLYMPCLTAASADGPATPISTETVRAGGVLNGPATPAVVETARPEAFMARPAAPASLKPPAAAPAVAPVAAPAVAAPTRLSVDAGGLTTSAGAFMGRPSATDSTVAGPATSVSTASDVTVGKLRDLGVEGLKAADMQILTAGVNAVMAQVGAQSVSAVIGLACVGPFATTP